MLCSAVSNYINSVKGLPFFYVVGDNEYTSILNELCNSGLSLVRVSDFCKKDDKFPSIDDMVDYFRTSDVDYRTNKCVVVGLGEYLALRGAAEADKVLSRLNNTTLGNARVVLLIRGVTAQAARLIKSDNRIEAGQRAHISDDLSCDITITNSKVYFGSSSNKGIKFLLRQLEDGANGDVKTYTDMPLDSSMFSITVVEDYYSAIRNIVPDFCVSKDAGELEFWEKLFGDIIKCDNDFRSVLEKYDFIDDYEEDFYNKVSGFEYKNWLFFIALKYNSGNISNNYLKLVVEETSSFLEFRKNILNAIIYIPLTNSNYMDLYRKRKKLVKGFPESDIAVFIKENSIYPEDSIYRFTDNTTAERMAIIKWVSKYGINDAINEVYPALGMYLKKYNFDCGSISEILTSYFDEYKRLKLTCTTSVDESFLAVVDDYAKKSIYARLNTRDSAVKAIKNKDSAFLYWIDALGVEYMSYITELARKKGLSISTDIARADLPTITKKNLSFYDQWSGKGKYKEEKLDDIKHNEKGGFIFSDKNLEPIHLVAELKVIEDAINHAAASLAMHECKFFVIASDHGASRLAVIHKQERQYDTDTKGEHSGRCCEFFKDCDIPCAIEDNGYISLGDYGRFKGSRAATVEVHGGASLEEVVVPIITLCLKSQSDIDIRVLDKDNIRPDRRCGTTVKLYISDVENTRNVRMIINGVVYIANCDDYCHYTFELHDIKRAKSDITADIYDGDNLIGNVHFDVKSRVASTDTGFADDLM